MKQVEKKRTTKGKTTKKISEQIHHLIYHRSLCLRKRLGRVQKDKKEEGENIDVAREIVISKLVHQLNEAKRFEELAKKNLDQKKSWISLLKNMKLREKDVSLWKKSILYHFDTQFLNVSGVYIESDESSVVDEVKNEYILKYFQDYRPYWFIGRITKREEKEDEKGNKIEGFNVLYEDGQLQWFSSSATSPSPAAAPSSSSSTFTGQLGSAGVTSSSSSNTTGIVRSSETNVSSDKNPKLPRKK
jgi:hypothetical protein